MASAVVDARVTLFMRPTADLLSEAALITGGGREVEVAIAIFRQDHSKAFPKISVGFGRAEIKPAPFPLRIVDAEAGDEARCDPFTADGFNYDAGMIGAKGGELLEEARPAITRVQHTIDRWGPRVVKPTAADLAEGGQASAVGRLPSR